MNLRPLHFTYNRISFLANICTNNTSYRSTFYKQKSPTDTVKLMCSISTITASCRKNLPHHLFYTLGIMHSKLLTERPSDKLSRNTLAFDKKQYGLVTRLLAGQCTLKQNLNIACLSESTTCRKSG